MKKTIVRKMLDEAIPYENNPRINDGAVDAVAESIKQCGYITPIVIDENNVILAGHTRQKALQRMGFNQEIDMVQIEGLPEEVKKKYRILDNKTAELSKWDYNKLAKELESLDFEGFDFHFEEEVKIDDFGDTFTLPDGDKPQNCTMSFNLKKQQWELIKQALEDAAPEIEETFGNDNKRGNCLYTIVS